MSRFNMPSVGTKTENLAGGDAYSQQPELQLVSILLTSFANEQYYRSSLDTFNEISNLLASVDLKFAAQAAIYARNEFGMRSISHVAAGQLAHKITGQAWAKNFYNKVIRRPDDITEILSYYRSIGGKNPTNAMKKGFSIAFGRFDEYQLAKYRSENKKFKLVDAANLVHPRPTEKNRSALKKLINGTLKSKDTWESKLTRSGQAANTEEEKAELKSRAWSDLLKENKLGYFALLRNLRNIMEQAPEMVDLACEQLVDEKAIKKSLVLPFRFLTAINEIQKSALPGTRKVIQAINNAIDISCNNVPEFNGMTLIVLDVSGSMQGRPSEIGSLFSAILYKSNVADIITFDNNARYVSPNPMDSTLTVAKSIPFNGGGTDFGSFFPIANKAYDRVFILSDMQGWKRDAWGSNLPHNSFRDFKKRHNCDPFVYSFDLAGYGTMQFPERNVFCMSGFSEKIFDFMKVLEQDKDALINKIKSVEL